LHEEVSRSGSSSSIKKEITLLMNGKRESLYDESREITFNDLSVHTVGEIFKSFAAKNEEMGEFEYYQKDGILHSCPKQPRVDLSRDDWWKTISELETLTKEEAELRYGCGIDHGLIVVRASRQHPDEIASDGKPKIHVGETHGWTQAVVPRSDGKFSVYAVGKYGDPYPSGLVDTFLYTFKTVKAIVTLSDENEFYSHREHSFIALPAGPDNIEKYFNKVREDLLKARRGELVFQGQGNNCAAFAQDTLDKAYEGITLPRFFEIDYRETTSVFPINYVVSFFRTVSDYTCSAIANICRIAFCTIFGAWRGYDAPQSASANVAGAAAQAPNVQPVPRLSENTTWLKGKLLLPAKIFHDTMQQTGKELWNTLRARIQKMYPPMPKQSSPAEQIAQQSALALMT